MIVHHFSNPIRNPFKGLLLFAFAGLLFFLFSSVAYSQQRPVTQADQLLELAEEWKEADRLEMEETLRTAGRSGFPTRIETEDGTVYQLMRLNEGMPEYYTTLNTRAAVTTATNHVQAGGRTGLNLTGAGMIVGEWDAGAVLQTHQELIDRVVQRDGATNVHNHAVHVAGTLIASGVRPDAKGMAPEATLWAHDWSFDSYEMAQAAADGLLISNHSYGSLAGWAFGDWSGESGWHWWGNPEIDPEEDYKFGFYDNRASQWDQVSYLAPYYLIVKSAGNNRNNNHSGSHFVFYPSLGEWIESDEFRQPDGGTFGYDCLPTYSNAKNILTVGAVGTIGGGYTAPADVRMSSFSSWGPTNDGRIKPDIVGDGVNLLSSNGNNNASYNQSSGTSMSGPNVAGSLLLIQQLHQQIHGEFMLSSSLRALAIHTADEAGNGPGPDYSFGWGLLNTERAAKFLVDQGNNRLIEDFLPSGDTLEFTVFGNGEDAVKISLAWIDPAASPLPASLNDPTPRLINDLDIRLIAHSGTDSATVFLPWILDPSNPAAPATTGDNFRDNVEGIDAGILPAGSYTLRITHKGQLFENTPQLFSLLISAPPSVCKSELLAVEKVNPACSNQDNGFVVLEGIQGLPPFNFSSDGLVFTEDSIFTDLAPGLYFFHSKDSLGCIGTTELSLIAPEPVIAETTDQVAVRLNEPQTHRTQFTYSNAFQTNGWGGDPSSGLVSAPLVPMDGGGNNFLGCGNLVNETDLNGAIAIARRGSCEFGDKALRAQNAGASAIVIINNEPGVMSMGAGSFGGMVNIPVYVVPQEAGDFLFSLLSVEDIEMSLGSHRAVIPASCFEGEDGKLMPFVTGGSPPYAFSWNTGDSTEHIQNLGRGTFLLTVTDSEGCEFEFEMNVDAPQPIKMNVQNVTNVSCPGNSDGSVSISADGGNGGYSYLWSTGDESANIDSLETGIYGVTITDQNGCIAIDSIHIGNPEPLLIDSLSTVSSCPDSPTGELEIVVSGGTAPFEFFINESEVGQNPGELDQGVYSILVRDHCGFEAEDSAVIALFSPPEAEIVLVADPDCANLNTGEILLDITVEAEPYQLIWSHGDISPNPLGLAAGIYSYTLSDACGMQKSDSIEITAPSLVEIREAEIREPRCPDAEDGHIELQISGGTGPLSFSWNTGDSTPWIGNLGAGLYILSVSDEPGCLYTFEFELAEPDPIQVEFTFDQVDRIVNFFNQSDSSDYFWDFGDGNTSTEVNPTHEYAEDGDYEVCLTATNSCGSTENCHTIQIRASNVEDSRFSFQLDLYPNPARNIINIEMVGHQLPEKIFIYNSIGELLITRDADEKMEIELGTLPSGMYWLKAGNMNRSFNISR